VTRTTYAFALLTLTAALALAGCGSSNDGTSGGAYGGGGGDSTETAKSPPGADSGAEVLTVADAPGVGPVLVESEGFTVYVFHGDKPLESTCYGACAETWPPVLSGPDPQVGEGATIGLLAQSPRKDGTQQVFYATHPLYTYSGDKKPGEANGQDIDSFGAEWYALKGNGKEAKD